MRFRSDPAAIRGSIAPLVSSFTADGRPDLDGLRALVRWQLESGAGRPVRPRAPVRSTATAAPRSPRAAGRPAPPPPPGPPR